MLNGGEGGIRTHGTVTRTTILRPLRLRWQLAVGVNSQWLQAPRGAELLERDDQS
jgi:hypothetical protein